MEALKRRIKHYSVIENNGFESLENLPHRIETRRPGSDIVSLRRLSFTDFIRTISREPHLATSFWWASIQEEAILREQIIRVGRRSAKERVAHLLLELNRRVAAIDGELKDFLSLPIPQTLIADALGLSVVHISRTMSKLKYDGMIETTSEGVRILQRDQLIKLSDFDNGYLHLERLNLST